MLRNHKLVNEMKKADEILKLLYICPEVFQLQYLAVNEMFVFIHTKTNVLYIGDLCVYKPQTPQRIVFHPGAVTINLDSGEITKYQDEAFAFEVKYTRCFIPSNELRDFVADL